MLYMPIGCASVLAILQSDVGPIPVAKVSARVRADRYEWAAGFIADWFAGRPSGMERSISKELRRQAWRAAEGDARPEGSQPDFGEADSVMCVT